MTTHEHPFWVAGKGWVAANALRAGDAFVTSDGRQVTLERVVDAERYVTVYNLEVEADHTSCVGDTNWDFDLWSHNHNDLPPWDPKVLAERRTINETIATKFNSSKYKNFANGSSAQTFKPIQMEKLIQSGRDPRSVE